jgi:hypothetical protein
MGDEDPYVKKLSSLKRAFDLGCLSSDDYHQAKKAATAHLLGLEVSTLTGTHTTVTVV